MIPEQAVPRHTSEVLPPALSKGEARTLESSARRHWRTANCNALVFAAELRRLHDGGAHLVRGYENFAVYAEQTFDGLRANMAKQLSRQGGVLLTLEQHGRIDFEASQLPVGPTALRSLSVVQNTFGEDAMLAVYDRAIELRPDRAIAEQTVKDAMRQLHGAPAPRTLPTGDESPNDEEDDDRDEDAGDDELSEEVNQLIDRLDILRQHVDDLRLSVDDPILARRELRNIEEEVGQVRAAMNAAYHDQSSEQS